MTNEKSDWIYCRLIDRGSFHWPRAAFWFGHFEFASDSETDNQCADALRTSMQAYAVSDAGEGASRLARVRVVILDETFDEARRTGSLYLTETVRLFNGYVAQLAPLRETEAGYLFNLRARSALPLSPVPETRNPLGMFMIIDERAQHPQHTLNSLLATSPDAHGELGLAFRRCAHWRELAQKAEDESERLLLNWMAAECLAKLGENDAVAPRLLAAVGLPSGELAKKLSSIERSALAALPAARSWRKHLAHVFDRLLRKSDHRERPDRRIVNTEIGPS